jgi:hypothetical protein
MFTRLKYLFLHSPLRDELKPGWSKTISGGVIHNSVITIVEEQVRFNRFQVFTVIKVQVVLAGKPEGKRRLGRPRRRWKIISEWM